MRTGTKGACPRQIDNAKTARDHRRTRFALPPGHPAQRAYRALARLPISAPEIAGGWAGQPPGRSRYPKIVANMGQAQGFAGWSRSVAFNVPSMRALAASGRLQDEPETGNGRPVPRYPLRANGREAHRACSDLMTKR